MTAQQQAIDWQCFVDAAAVAQQATAIILQAARDAIAARGVFKLVLAGGHTPANVYQQLANSQSDWSRWQLYFGDERCLPIDHRERNSQMVNATWLQSSAIPKDNVHAIPAELGAEVAAVNYAAVIGDVLPFDLVLLGMGEDGHTASLFPGINYDENASVHAVHNAPKPPPDRVSLSTGSLSNSQQVLVLITGAGKHTALQQWRNGEALPIAGISALDTMTVLFDAAAEPNE